VQRFRRPLDTRVIGFDPAGAATDASTHIDEQPFVHKKVKLRTV
jgi:hypothetical protein